jgi:hypothetical protein
MDFFSSLLAVESEDRLTDLSAVSAGRSRGARSWSMRRSSRVLEPG